MNNAVAPFWGLSSKHPPRDMHSEGEIKRIIEELVKVCKGKSLSISNLSLLLNISVLKRFELTTIALYSFMFACYNEWAKKDVPKYSYPTAFFIPWKNRGLPLDCILDKNLFELYLESIREKTRGGDPPCTLQVISRSFGSWHRNIRKLGFFVMGAVFGAADKDMLIGLKRPRRGSSRANARSRLMLTWDWHAGRGAPMLEQILQCLTREASNHPVILAYTFSKRALLSF
jgi:hypothetical protein